MNYCSKGKIEQVGQPLLNQRSYDLLSKFIGESKNHEKKTICNM